MIRSIPSSWNGFPREVFNPSLFRIRQIRAAEIDRVILSSDLGQTNAPYFDEGMEEYQRLLLAEGLTEEELEIMLVRTPERLIG